MSKLHWLGLSTVRGIGGVTLRRLLERFRTPEAILEAPEEELLCQPRVTPKVVARIRGISWEAVGAELEDLKRQGLGVLTWDDTEYPERLRGIEDAPPVLFVRGRLAPAEGPAVAIIGTRQPSSEKRELAKELARELARRGVTVISGLARGIDTAAHEGALQAETGRTLAVPGSGLLALHPRENIPLAERIAERGALLSELRPATVARGPVLMARNRILTGLSHAVLVVEAGERSGALQAAEKARKQGRPLFAVPESVGTNVLLHIGARRVDPRAASLEHLCQQIITAAGQELEE